MSSWTDSLNSVVGSMGSLANTVVDTKNKWTGTTKSETSSNTSLDNLAASIANSASSNKKLIIIGIGGLVAVIALFMIIKK